MIGQVDRDGDGDSREEEFPRIMEKICLLMLVRLGCVERVHANGRVAIFVPRACCQGAWERMTDTELSAMIDKVDQDGDGVAHE